MLLSQIIAFFTWLWTLNGVKALTISIIVNLTVALAAAVRTSTFKPHKIADFLFKQLAPYVLVYGVIKAIALETPNTPYAAITPIVWGILEINLAANLIENLGWLGVPLPQWLKVLVSKQIHNPVEPPRY